MEKSSEAETEKRTDLRSEPKMEQRLGPETDQKKVSARE
jgi:hypothetical protein